MSKRIVIPGEEIEVGDDMEDSRQTRIGFGVIQNGPNSLVASKGGQLIIYEEKKMKKYYVENYQMRYIPVVNESVIGVIIDKQGDDYRVDIGAPQIANLSIYAFEGASKRNRPNLSTGCTVYARIVNVQGYSEPELSCVLDHGKAGGYGEISGGYLIRRCSLSLCRKLLSEELNFFNHFGKEIPFEIAIGMNGRIWIKSDSRKNSILIANAVLKSEFLDENGIMEIVDLISQRITK